MYAEFVHGLSQRIADEVQHSMIWKLLYYVSSALEPFSYSDLMALLSLSCEDELEALITWLYPIVIVEPFKQDNDVLRVMLYHKTLYDWLLTHHNHQTNANHTVESMLTERLLAIGHMKLSDPNFLIQLSLSKYTPQQVYLPLIGYWYEYLLDHLDALGYESLTLQFLTSLYYIQSSIQYQVVFFKS